ncbi:hypothetical protein NBRC116583_35180 [Arenicella sp. 4NH20-0111]
MDNIFIGNSACPFVGGDEQPFFRVFERWKSARYQFTFSRDRNVQAGVSCFGAVGILFCDVCTIGLPSLFARDGVAD